MIEREIFHDGMLVVTQCSGILTAEELSSSSMWMVKSFGVNIKPGFCQLFNALEADSSNIIEEDIHRVAHINISFAKTRGEFTMAVVAIQPYPLQLANLHKELSAVSNINVKLFDDVNTAYKWLGFSSPL